MLTKRLNDRRLVKKETTFIGKAKGRSAAKEQPRGPDREFFESAALSEWPGLMVGYLDRELLELMMRITSSSWINSRLPQRDGVLMCSRAR